MMDEPAELAEIDRIDRGSVLTRFGAEEAWRLGGRLRERAAMRQATVAIEIRRSNGTVLFTACLGEATPDHGAWAARKIAVALRFERSSLAVAMELRARGLSLADFGVSPRRCALAGGAMPLRVEGAGCVGAAAVSGLTSVEDHDLVVEAITWLRSTQGH